MKVFISWSGDLSKKIAEVLHVWIEDVLQGTDAWISTDDIDKGSLWFSDIANGLSETGVGILCLTKDNVSAPWLLFEAGALSKGLTKSRVCPLLVNLAPADLKAPLSQFNATMPTKDDMLKLLKTINNLKGEQALTDEKLQKAFDRWWGEFEAKFAEVLKTQKPQKPVAHRPPEDMIEEILEIVRSLQNSAQKPNPISPSIVTWSKPEASLFEKWLETQKTFTPPTSGSASLESVLQSIDETQKQREENKLKMSEIFQQIMEQQKKKKSPLNEVLAKYFEEQAKSKKGQQDPKKDKS